MTKASGTSRPSGRISLPLRARSTPASQSLPKVPAGDLERQSSLADSRALASSKNGAVYSASVEHLREATASFSSFQEKFNLLEKKINERGFILKNDILKGIGLFSNVIEKVSEILSQVESEEGFGAIKTLIHDFNNQSTSISFYLGLLGKHFMNRDKTKEHLSIINTFTPDIDELLINMKSVLSGEGSEKLKISKFKAETIFWQLEKAFSFGSSSASSIDLSFLGNEGKEITSDRFKVFRILENLVSNARKEIAKRGIAASIKVKLEIKKFKKSGQKAFAVFTVENSGTKILKAIKGKLFKEEVQSTHNGFGIGLKGSAELARKLGGYLSLARDGRGKSPVSFKLIIPRKI